MIRPAEDRKGPINPIADIADTMNKIADIKSPINPIADIADTMNKIADIKGPINPISEVLDNVKEAIEPEKSENFFIKIIKRIEKSWEGFQRAFEAEDGAEFWLKITTAFYDYLRILRFEKYFGY